MFVGLLVDARSVCRPRFWKVQRTRCFYETVFRLSSTLDDFLCLLCVRQVFWEMFSLLCCFVIRFILFDALNLWVDLACVILISSNGNICYSLFTLIVTFYFLFYDMSIWCVFCFILTWKHFAFSRERWTLINGWKWRRWKLWYASCCFSFYFPCVFVCSIW